MSSPVTGRLPRRTLIGAAASAVVAGGLGFRPTVARAQTPTPDIDWETFDAAVRDGMQTFGMVGAAVAIVTADGIDHRNTFGVRDLMNGAPFTPDTHCLVGSTTKSMSSLLVATLVDDGALAWDQPVREVWPDFRAPSDALTRELRVRDLFGMASGIGEPDSTVLHFADPTAGELLRSLVNLPIDSPPNSQFFYNNTLYAVGGYLPPLLNTTAEDLETAYARLMAERVYRPAGMTDARIASDPRPFVSDYATGHAPDFVHGTAAEPYASLGSYAPAGGTLANPAAGARRDRLGRCRRTRLPQHHPRRGRPRRRRWPDRGRGRGVRPDRGARRAEPESATGDATLAVADITVPAVSGCGSSGLLNSSGATDCQISSVMKGIIGCSSRK